MAKKTTTRRKKAKRPPRRAAKRLPVSAARVRAAALACDTVVEAAGVLDCEPTLEICLDTYPVLAEAWRRGQFLRRLGHWASVAATVSEAAKDLDMEPTELRDTLASDRICRDLWRENRHRLRVEVKAGFVEAIRNGDVSATGIARIERILTENVEGEPVRSVGTDIERVPQQMLELLLGVSRVTLHNWATQKGMPKNPDSSYNLKEVIPWWRRYIEDKLLAGGPKGVMPGGMTRLQRAKAVRAEMEVDELAGRLWPREEVIDHWIGLAQVAANTLSRRTAVEYGHRLAGQPDEVVTAELERLFARLRRDLATLPADVTLPETVVDLYAQIAAALAADQIEHGTEHAT